MVAGLVVGIDRDDDTCVFSVVYNCVHYVKKAPI